MNITITVEKVLCSRPAQKWYRLHGSTESGNSTICKGTMEWEPREMETLKLSGEFVIYKGEREFQFFGAAITLPLDPFAQLNYVCQRTLGIGPQMTLEIWKKRGEKWRDLELGEIKRMQPETLEMFREKIREFDSDSEKAEVIAWLEDKGLTQAFAGAAWEKFRSDTAGVINANCYRLAEVPGYGFSAVDGEIRRAFGIADDDPRRIRAGVYAAMDQISENGDTAFPALEHLEKSRELLNLGDELIISEVRKMEKEKLIVFFGGEMASSEDYQREKMILEFCSGTESTKSTESTEELQKHITEGLEFTPDDTQIDAVLHAIGNRFSIVNGGAGVGKTTVIQMIHRGIQKRFPQYDIRLAAPTGKAAARLKEASGLQATTIHVLLGAKGANLFSAETFKNTAIIVDESSMVDTLLMSEICKRQPARLVLVGDQAQLVPVGKGQPFHDLIRIHPEAVRTLSKCYRATEAVFEQAQRIRKGNMPDRNAESQKERWAVKEFASAETAENYICEMAYSGLIDFRTDIVLCPKNGKKVDDVFQSATVNSLNLKLLEIDRHGAHMEQKFIPGDRVINTENMPDLQIWNGTTGEIHSVDQDGNIRILLDDPVTVNGESRKDVLIPKDQTKALQYAYALTIHKSQGSQYRKTFILALGRDRFLLDRSLIYTAVTRTRNECTVIGNFAALETAINRQREKVTVMQKITGEI